MTIHRALALAAACRSFPARLLARNIKHKPLLTPVYGTSRQQNLKTVEETQLSPGRERTESAWSRKLANQNQRTSYHCEGSHQTSAPSLSVMMVPLLLSLRSGLATPWLLMIPSKTTVASHGRLRHCVAMAGGRRNCPPSPPSYNRMQQHQVHSYS